jgi:formylglycine-generating enzyme required for sulfatase activity
MAQKTAPVKKRKTKGAKEESIDLGKGITLQLVLILAGKFQMGSDPSDEDHNDDETQYEATISKPFYLGKHQITQAQWEVVMGYNPSKIKGHDLPVTNVSWDDCQKFINNLNADSVECFRLPTEAEWEFSCRAGTNTPFSFGDRITTVDANCDYKIRKPVAVGSYEPNAFGLYDMHGNVSEWCNDWYGVYPKGPTTDPKGSANGKDHVMRGGSFCVKASSVRSALRNSGAPNFQSHDLGFRIAQTIGP